MGILYIVRTIGRWYNMGRKKIYPKKRREGGFMGKVIKFISKSPKPRKELSKQEIMDAKSRLLYDDDTYLQKVYKEILKEM